MAKSDIQNPAFTDEDKARETLETLRWPDGPYCPHCGNADQDKIAKGLGKASRRGLYYCASCNGQFTVTIGTVMEDTKIPLSKWLFAMHLLGASKKGMSALQLSRMLGVTYKSAWFLCHRIREAMAPKECRTDRRRKVVEADESFIGGKAKNRAYAKKEPAKHVVLTLVERDCKSRSFHIANVKAKTLREKIVSRKSHLMTDELASFEKVGKEFANHGTVNHSENEFAKFGGFAHTNTAECRFSLMKRAVFGTHHSISEAHLQRYLAEWDFGAALIAHGIEGKRLSYGRLTKPRTLKQKARAFMA